MMEIFDQVVHVSISALFNGVWQGMVIAGVIWVGMLISGARKRFNATERFAVLFVTMGVIASLPFLLAFQQVLSSGSTSIANDTGSVPGSSTGLLFSDIPDEGIDIESVGYVSPNSMTQNGGISSNSSQYTGVGARSVPSIDNPQRSGIAIRDLPQGILVVIFGFWVMISSFLCVRLWFSWYSMGKLKRGSRPISEKHRRRIEGKANEWHIKRSVHLVVSDQVSMPAAAGLMRPAVIIPSHLLDALSEDELDQVILHEIAHLQRWDDWTNLMQKLALALFFFFPALIWLVRRLDAEREMACDEWVVSRTNRPKTYAASLTKLIPLVGHSRQVLVMPGMAQKRNQLVERVRIVLDRKTMMNAQFSGRSLFVFFCVLVLSVSISAFTVPIVVVPESTTNSAITLEEEEPTEELTLVETVQSVRNEDTPPLPQLTQASVPTDIDKSVVADEDSRVTLPELLPVQTRAPGPVDVRLDHSALPYSANTKNPDPISKRSLIKTIRAAAKISSSGDRARFLKRAVDVLPEDEDVFVAYIETAATLPSSGDCASTLIAFLTGRSLGAISSIALLNAAEQISSDSDKTRVLIHVIDHLSEESAVYDAYMTAVETISSSTDYRRCVTAFLEAVRE